MPDGMPILTLAAGVENLPLLTTLAFGFAAAWVLGLITHRLGLSPIVGYLLAGVAIGPHTPGFMGDIGIAQQLAEIGVILLMFGVGLHFQLKDLWAVRGVAIPGAIGQSLVATVVTVGVLHLLGWPLRSGLILGMAMAVASTVVLLRVLLDRNMLGTVHGHVAVGWLIVEDIMTVLLLVMVPLFAIDESGSPTAAAADSALATAGWAVLKLIALVAIVLLAGSRISVRPNSSRSRCSSFRSRSLSAAPACSAHPSPSAPSLRESSSRSRRSATTRRRMRCRCAMRSRCSSSCRSACCSTRSSWSTSPCSSSSASAWCWSRSRSRRS
jgi:Kef-type K+ transport system membrane component KefB